MHADNQLGAPLSLSGVKHCYQRFVSLHGVSLECEPGAITCLLGPSGCGKSTLLRCIAGHEPICDGTITLGDTTLVDGKSCGIAPEKRHVGMVFQDYALFPHLRVWQNVAFGLTGMSKKAKKQHAIEMLQHFGLEDLAERYPHTCSGGQQQRIALARALAVSPQAMLLDEPFSGLDASLREALRSDLHRVLCTLGLPTIMVTHDPAEALACADKIALMRDGKIVQCGTPSELWNHPVDLEAMAFFSPVTRLDATVRAGQCHSQLGSWACDAADGDYDLALRREALIPDENGPICANITEQHAHGNALTISATLKAATADCTPDCNANVAIDATVKHQGALPACTHFALDMSMVHVFPRA